MNMPVEKTVMSDIRKHISIKGIEMIYVSWFLPAIPLPYWQESKNGRKSMKMERLVGEG